MFSEITQIINQVNSFYIDKEGNCEIEVENKEGIFLLKNKFNTELYPMHLTMSRQLSYDTYSFLRYLTETEFTIDNLITHENWTVKCIKDYTKQQTKTKVKPNGTHKHRPNKKRG